ncbi:MAG: bifunctional 2-polyprenyl-6-hydroxyphenol methylase/3-demethylubiquinol 3-O-methyltransferase UbiG [Pseudomonadota bacterium]
MNAMENVDSSELARFDAVASRWWDPDGEFGALHRINPIRLEYVMARCGLADVDAADIGCGGGLLTEAMARNGANVTGVDMSKKAIQVAQLHMHESELEIDYRQTTAEALAESKTDHFDVVTCMEMLEHVPAPEHVVGAVARMAKPGGDIFFSTINRTAKAFALAIVGAEYILNWVPKGTHEFAKFIKPAELDSAAREHGLVLQSLTGLAYDPLSDRFSLGKDIDVNYFAHYKKLET